MINFKDWLQAQENSPIGRSKIAMAFGIGPDLPMASLNSRATINPCLLQAILDGHKEKKHKKKKSDKKKD